MRIIGLAGWSGSGKTTLITKLIPRLLARGVRVSTLKHAHHGFDLDQPGKDSFMHRAAGATEVIISSAKRWAILHELREGSRNGTSARWSARCRRSIWCWSKASSAMPFPSWKSIGPRTASRCCIRTIRTSSRSPATVRCRRPRSRWSISTTSRRSPICCSSMPCPVDHDRQSGMMAQLTDDCFAFSGPLLPLEDMERLIGERVAPVSETERVPLRGARGRVSRRTTSWRRSICRRSIIPRSTAMPCAMPISNRTLTRNSSSPAG